MVWEVLAIDVWFCYVGQNWLEWMPAWNLLPGICPSTGSLPGILTLYFRDKSGSGVPPFRRGPRPKQNSENLVAASNCRLGKKLSNQESINVMMKCADNLRRGPGVEWIAVLLIEMACDCIQKSTIQSENLINDELIGYHNMDTCLIPVYMFVVVIQFMIFKLLVEKKEQSNCQSGLHSNTYWKHRLDQTCISMPVYRRQAKDIKGCSFSPINWLVPSVRRW